MGVLRILEIIFFFYFASHIPITLFIDLQALLPAQLYPQQLKDLLRWYGAEFRDPMMLDPPTWFKSFIFCEALVQIPFFPIAAYAFLKGGCKWIRTPAIVYSTHVATTLVPILAHILYYPFPTEPHPGPQTQKERYTLAVIYAPYLLVPLMLLFTMLFSSAYNTNTQGGKGSAYNTNTQGGKGSAYNTNTQGGKGSVYNTNTQGGKGSAKAKKIK